MRTFFNVEDIGDLNKALSEAKEVKANRFGFQGLGKNKTLLMIFFNNSLRTRLSTQKRRYEPRHECHCPGCQCGSVET